MTVVVRRSDGEKGALRGSGLGPWIEAVTLSEEVGGISVDWIEGEELGISR